MKPGEPPGPRNDGMELRPAFASNGSPVHTSPLAPTKGDPEELGMSQSIKRKDFLTLTISIATLSAVSAVGCGDDDDSTNGGTAGKGGGGSGGNAGNGTSGSSAGNSPQGGKNGTAGSGGKNNGGSGGTGGANGGSGGTNTGGSGGKDGHAGEGGGESYGGEGGAGGEGYGGESYGGEGGAGGAGGDGPVAAPKCGGAHLTQTAGSATHNHLTGADGMFTAYVNGSNHAIDFTLPLDGGGPHSHTIHLSAEDFDTLLNGGTITLKESSNDFGHTHTYTISCG
jgi:hypothetical protein